MKDSQKEEREESLTESIIGLFSIVILLPIRGYVLSMYWEWFIVPIGAPSIGIAHALGISIIITWLARGNYNKPKLNTWWGKILFFITLSGLILLTGYVVHLFM